MADEQQTVIDSTVAGVTTPTSTSNGSGNQQETAEYWKKQYEVMESRYKGASTKINEYDKDVKTWQQKFAAKEAEAEGLRASSTNEVTDWKTKAQTFEQQTTEQTKKLAEYEREKNIRKLIHNDFKDLSTDFETDEVFQFGVLHAAATLDEAALKASLTKSLEVRKGKMAAAAEGAVTGATSTPPPSGSTTAANEQQLADQIRAERDPQKKEALWVKLIEARKRTQS